MNINVLEKIDKLRIEKGWSFYKLAEESMVSQSTILNMFARKTLPSITTLDLICKGLGITLSNFFLEDEAKDNQAEICQLFFKLSPKEQNAIKNLVYDLSKK